MSCGRIVLSGSTMCLVRTEYGQDLWNRALEAGVIETKSTDDDPNGMKVLNALSKKQRRRTGPFESHAAARYPVRHILEKYQLEYLEEHAESNGKVEAEPNGKVEAKQADKAEASDVDQAEN